MLDENTRIRRRNLKSQPGCMFVDPEEFQVLAVSTRKFYRSDDPVAEVRGLLDPTTGERFITEEERLFTLHFTHSENP